MTTYTAEEIRKHALGRSSIRFLKSQAVASAVAAKVEARLKGSQGAAATVEAGPDPRYPGSWRVVVMHIPLSQAHSVGAYAVGEINSQEGRAIRAALRAAFDPKDLLTRWTRPARRR